MLTTRRLPRSPDAVVLEQLAEAMGALRSTFKRVVCLVFNINYTALSLVKVVLFMLWNSREMLYVFKTIYTNSNLVISHPILCVAGVHRLVSEFVQRLCQAVLFCRETIYLTWGFSCIIANINVSNRKPPVKPCNFLLEIIDITSL